MTIAAFVKVFDGLVLAADSATTLVLPDGTTQVYNTADKIFHLHRRLPIGAMTWGAGQIGAASIATLSKDLRRRLAGKDPEYQDWELDPASYTIEGVADRMFEMFSDLYRSSETPGVLGLLTAGYSSGTKDSEVRVMFIDQHNPVRPQVVAREQDAGWQSYAQPEATQRLFLGLDDGLRNRVRSLVPIERYPDLDAAFEDAFRSPAVPPMPLPDAIAFAKYLVDVTVGYRHFILGPDTVGGLVELACISRHEGFKWVSRKHYYTAELNREDPSHA